MAFNQYGMPQDMVQQQSQRAGQTGSRAPRPQAQSSPFANGNTGVAGGQQQQQPQGAPVPAQPMFDLEATRKAWTSTGDISNPQGWLDANSNITGGATLQGEKLFNNGQFVADLVGNYKDNDKSNDSRIFLDGIGDNGQRRTASGGAGGAGMPGGGGFSPYAPGKLPQTNYAVYKPGQLSQYQNVDQGGMESSVMQAVQQALAGGSLSPEIQAQMQGQLKDQALTMQMGQQQDIRQNFANRGMGGGAGQENALLSALGQNTQTGLLNNYRDLGIAAAQVNRGDLERAIALGDGTMNNQVQRHTQQFDTGMRGQLGQENLNQLGVQSQNAATQFALQRALEEEGLRQAAAGLGLTQRGQDLQNSQFGQSLAQSANQFGQQMGYNYTALNVNNNNTQQQAILRALGLA